MTEVTARDDRRRRAESMRTSSLSVGRRGGSTQVSPGRVNDNYCTVREEVGLGEDSQKNQHTTSASYHYRYVFFFKKRDSFQLNLAMTSVVPVLLQSHDDFLRNTVKLPIDLSVPFVLPVFGAIIRSMQRWIIFGDRSIKLRPSKLTGIAIRRIWLQQFLMSANCRHLRLNRL